MSPTPARRRTWLQQAPQPQRPPHPHATGTHTHTLCSKGKEPRHTSTLPSMRHGPLIIHQGRRHSNTPSAHRAAALLLPRSHRKEPQTGTANRHSMRPKRNYRRNQQKPPQAQKTNRHSEALVPHSALDRLTVRTNTPPAAGGPNSSHTAESCLPPSGASCLLEM